jgi:transcriptional regulator with XRE-family HTH domain
MSDIVSTYARTVGDVIRSHRKANGWTRKQLRAELPDTADISLQTLATYELGTRHIHVDRLDEVARALGTRAHVILAEVDRRVYPAAGDKLVVDLAMLAKSTRCEILPAARWAAASLAALGSLAEPVVGLTPDALDVLANVCGLAMLDLFVMLRDFQPQK